MDSLSSLLSYLKPHARHAGRFDLGVRQAVAFPRYEGLKCYVLIAGHCWLTLDGNPQTTPLEPGDCFLLAHGHAFCLESERGSPVADLAELVIAMRAGLPGLYEGKPACTLAGGHFTFQGGPIDLLSEFLPSLIILPRKTTSFAMQITLERMREELLTDQLGGSFLVQQLAYQMLVDAIRSHLAAAKPEAIGWLYAMSDEQLGPALMAIHDTPSHAWTLETLAKHVGMSRSLFARRFREKVGESPIDHLTRWRMMRASEQLIATKKAVIEIANASGYQSESSFGKAFKRITGCSPRQHRFGWQGGTPPEIE